MKNIDTNILLQWIEESLSPEDQESVRRRINADPVLQKEVDQLKQTQFLLRMTANQGTDAILQPFFTDNLMKKLADQAKPIAELDFAASLLQVFRPIAVACLLIMAVLIGYNSSTENTYQSEQTAVEALFDIPPVTVATAYTMEWNESYNNN